MITTENVTFAYNKNEILSDISFIAPTGKITYLAGVNGAGKTTWIKCATTLLKPKGGAILFDGKTFDNVRKEFAICFDTPPIYKHMSCVDNLQVLYEVDYKKDEVREMAEAIGLHGHNMSQPAGKLSYGQRHRLGILGALSRGAKYLILDEPDLGLDPFAVDYVYKKIKTCKENGCTILITGQNFIKMQELCDHFCVINNGRIAVEMPVREALEQHAQQTNSLEKAFYNIVGGHA